MKIAIIGGGNIGFALADAVLSKRIVAPADLVVIEKKASRVAEIKQQLNCTVFESSHPSVADSAANCDVILMAVKPQDFAETAKQFMATLRPNTLLISIMAGVTIEKIGLSLGNHPLIIRSMPNLPVKVGRGMTVYTASPSVTQEHKKVAKAIFNATGRSLFLPDEQLMNAATAVSGTGPAYLFYLVECLIDSAKELGFDQEQAELLSYQTFLGALELWWDSQDSVGKLREMVTSRGGTTEAAFKVFDSEKLGEIFKRGVIRACERAKELAE